MGAQAVTSLRSDAGRYLLFMHCCVREAQQICSDLQLCYDAGVLAGVAAGAAAGAAVVLSEDAGVDELVDEVDAGVVLLEVDLLSVL
ncbi:unannotated protein [freshwater metagenome]|uniref:Unannotated protein n=1 Tax=freshwater metagenome TaxID=449393 RepID=A0A6J7L5C3_9ZZZZ